MPRMTPADAQALADRVYAGDLYDTGDERLFALLVDVAAAYEATTGAQHRDTNLLAVRENLDINDERAAGGPEDGR